MADERWRINITVDTREYALIQKKAAEQRLKPTTWVKQQLLLLIEK